MRPARDGTPLRGAVARGAQIFFRVCLMRFRCFKGPFCGFQRSKQIAEDAPQEMAFWTIQTSYEYRFDAFSRSSFDFLLLHWSSHRFLQMVSQSCRIATIVWSSTLSPNTNGHTGLEQVCLPTELKCHLVFVFAVVLLRSNYVFKKCKRKTQSKVKFSEPSQMDLQHFKARGEWLPFVFSC